MNKFLGYVYLFSSLVWCLVLFPISFIVPVVKIYQMFFSENSSASGSDFTIVSLVVFFAGLFSYIILKFGLSLIRSSLNMIKGKKELTPQERLDALVKKKLNKVKNVNASKAGTDAQKDARPF